MSYIVPPGLYALGSPDSVSPVVVTANYKMTYDLVRSALAGQSVWLLVLETYGINVWCAAGKGTFGTGELVRRVKAVSLAEVVSHRQLILPLLGAAGVKGVEVAKRCGFIVVFATIRAADLPDFLEKGALPLNSRELTFTVAERLVLTPIELITALRRSWILLILLFMAGGFFSGDFYLPRALLALSGYLAAVLSGAVVAPLLLPWLPSAWFAVKGAATGLLAGLLFCRLAGVASLAFGAATILMIAAVSSFLMLNFTGSTPYTSRSGVKKEMKWALPLQALALLTGAVLFVFERFA
jgi:acetyl-CoA decarbonylase/synthase complex subunit gamma